MGYCRIGESGSLVILQCGVNWFRVYGISRASDPGHGIPTYCFQLRCVAVPRQPGANRVTMAYCTAEALIVTVSASWPKSQSANENLRVYTLPKATQPCWSVTMALSPVASQRHYADLLPTSVPLHVLGLRGFSQAKNSEVRPYSERESAKFHYTI